MGAITVAFKKEFANTLYLLAQQSGSKFLNNVRYETDLTGEAKFYTQYGEDSANVKNTRHQDIEYSPDDYSRRMVTPQKIYWSKILDTEDEISMGLDPKSALMTAGKNAIGKKIDDVIIAALRGTALTGTSGGTSTTLPAAQKIAVAASGLTLTKLLDVKELFDAAEVPEDDRYFPIGAVQLRELLNISEIKSADYNTVRALAAGKMGSFLGFNFFLTNRLVKSSTTRYCTPYQKSGILFASNGGVTTSVDKLVAKVGQPSQLYSDIYGGATRMEVVMVAEVACQE
jgi:hypothetical protein